MPSLAFRVNLEDKFPSNKDAAVPQIVYPEIAGVPGFTGREAELEALGAALWSKAGRAALTNASASVALSGHGGVGKSALAREYAWRERPRYHCVWWLRAQTRETLLDDLIELGARFIPGLADVPDREAAARATVELLAQTPVGKPWLLIYDNAESAAGIGELTPRAAAHILITSRWQDWHGHASELAVDVFSPQVAIGFLMALARGAAERPDETLSAAARLAEELGCLPLALAIARGHAWSVGWSFEQYRGHLAQMLDRELPQAVEYPRSIAATLTLAIEEAESASPKAGRLLGIAAFLAPDRIPLGIVTEDVMSEMAIGQAVAALAEVSLVTRDILEDGSPAIRVHRLVQEVMRRRVEDGTASMLALAMRLVANAYPGNPDDVHTWPACRRLEAHAGAVLAFAPDADDAAETTAHLLNLYAVHLNARAEFARAEPMMRRALAIDERSLGPDHPKVAIRLNNLAGLLRLTNRLAEAESLYRRALAIDETSFGPDHPKVAIRLNNLAGLLRLTNRLAEAELLYRRALAIDETSFRPDHPNVTILLNNMAIRLNNLAGLLRLTNRLAEAESLYRRALAIDETSFGPDHPNVAIRLNNLAALLTDTDRLTDAEPLARRALTIFEKSLGAEHPSTQAVHVNYEALLARLPRGTAAPFGLVEPASSNNDASKASSPSSQSG
jgi:tetratricopeptide (TPR) repeat protein